MLKKQTAFKTGLIVEALRPYQPQKIIHFYADD
jgi:hypothetical protein